MDSIRVVGRGQNNLFASWAMISHLRVPTMCMKLMAILLFSQAINLIPIAAVFLVPLVIGLVIVTARSSATGELDISRLMSGDVR